MSENDPSSPPLEGPYIAYPKAMARFAERLKASPEELAVWIFMWPEDPGGLPAYTNANERDPPDEFNFDQYSGDDPDCRDYLSHLMECWFREQDTLNFSPTRRFITCAELIERWSGHPKIQPEAFIRAKIMESRLLDVHPVSGLTQGSMSGDEWYPPMSDGAFELSKIEAIEKEDFDFAKGGNSETTANGQAGRDNTPDANLGGATIRAEIRESRLLDVHSVSGLTQGSMSGDEWHPPMSDGSFELSKIEAIEKEDFDFAKGGNSETTANGQAGRDNTPDANLGGATDPCAVFRAMESLAASEVAIAFVGDRNEDGLGPNNMLEISARGVRKRVTLAALELIDKRNGKLNLQGGILLGFAQNRMPPRDNKNSKRIYRSRASLRRCLDVNEDPFEDCQLRGGWQPRFQIVDRRGAADDRARREGERHTESLEAIKRGDQFADAGEPMRPSRHEEDDAAAWLREYDLGSDDST